MADWDVIVAGAGTAGAATAYHCARAGMRVLMVDRRPADACGARWLNGVALWQLEEAEIPPPPADELFAAPGVAHLVAGWGPQRVRVEPNGAAGHGLADLDMRALVRRLHGLAEGAGATLRFDVRATGADDAGLVTTAGTLRADVLVDATGLNGLRLLGSPAVDPRQICVATQEVRRVTDLKAAHRFFEERGVGVDQALAFTGVAGGYSLMRVRLNGDEVDLLAGSIPAEGHPPGRGLIDRFVQEQTWIGPCEFGGSRAIPVRRPFERLAAGRRALVGDAGCQVFPSHGSGIGLGLIAGRELARALEDGTGVAGYAAGFQRRHGGMLAAHELFRRRIQPFSGADLGRLMGAGLLDGEMSAATMAQRWPQVRLRDLPRRLLGAARAPDLSARMAGVFVGMGRLRALYRRFPEDAAALPRWSRRVARVFGGAPELA